MNGSRMMLNAKRTPSNSDNKRKRPTIVNPLRARRNTNTIVNNRQPQQPKQHNNNKSPPLPRPSTSVIRKSVIIMNGNQNKDPIEMYKEIRNKNQNNEMVTRVTQMPVARRIPNIETYTKNKTINRNLIQTAKKIITSKPEITDNNKETKNPINEQEKICINIDR
eukprot:UN25286